MPRAKTLSLSGYGGRRIVFRSAGSTPNASPGNPSVTRLTHRIWSAVKRDRHAEERRDEQRDDLAHV